MDEGQSRRRQLAGSGARSIGTSTRSRSMPPAVRNWNWPDIADAFSQGTLGAYIDAHSSAAVLMNPEKSKVIGKMAFARWPAGPTGKRCTSIWNWGFPINAALDEKQKRATWVHSVGGRSRNAGAHIVEVCRPGEALWLESHVAVALTRVRRDDQGHRSELRRRRAHVARARHRRRTGGRAFRSGRRSATRWRPRFSPRWSDRRSRKRRSTKRRHGSTRY